MEEQGCMPGLFELVTPEGKGILGELDEKGVVTFAIEAGPTSSIRGTEMFNRMLDSFGESVTAIRGCWVKGLPDKPSTNIDKVSELCALGVGLDEAVLEAWTVTRARKRGFTAVVVLNSMRDISGVYSNIEVFITK